MKTVFVLLASDGLYEDETTRVVRVYEDEGQADLDLQKASEYSNAMRDYHRPPWKSPRVLPEDPRIDTDWQAVDGVGTSYEIQQAELR